MPNRSAHRGILVGADGSASAKVALRWAAREAVMRNVALTIVHMLLHTFGGLVRMGVHADRAGPTPRQKGQQIIHDATRIVQVATKDSGRLQTNTEMLFRPGRSHPRLS